MDLVATMAQQLGVDEAKARAVAGAVLGAARAQVPAEETKKLDQGVPELAGWMTAAQQALAAPAPAATDGGGWLGNVLEAAGSGLGNQILGAVVGQEASQAASAVALLSRLGLQPQHAAMVAPALLSFLSHRLGTEWTERIVAAAPILAGMGAVPTTPAATDPAGLLSSLLKG